MKKNLLLVLICLLAMNVYAQTIDVYPTHWWAGMKWNNVQLLMRSADSDFSKQKISINYPGISISNTHAFQNGKYVALNINIQPSAKPGTVIIKCGNTSVNWQLKRQREGNGTAFAQGVTAADFIYLLMPDRFSNGDPTNDKFADMNDTASDVHNPFLRHGGDLQGIINHLDYFNDLGVTAIWPTPVIENNQGLTNEGGSMRSAYHGYGFTDQYKIDKRFGGDTAYIRLVDSAHARKLKIIQDAVYNHIGDKHFLFMDPPDKNWFNQWPAYTNSSYKDQPMVDEYASKKDYDLTVKGWFVPFLPDLDQSNPYVANYLIQYALWAVEEYGIDGWRVDTYYYNDKNFLNNINEALVREFPHITVFGETLMQTVVAQAYYCDNNIITSWKSNLQGCTDFRWRTEALNALTQPFGWTSGITNLYTTLMQDILYKKPMRNCIFLDNHDMDRFYSIINEDFDKYKLGMTLLLTQRGIPQLYYGTEILMKNFKDPSDAEVRKDFPGGWAGDSSNKFVATGRTEKENEAYNYVKKLAHFRMQSKAIGEGKTMQYVPADSMYIYFRYTDAETVMCIINTGDKEQSIDFSQYAERTQNFKNAVDITSDKNYETNKPLVIGAKQSVVLSLK